MTLSRLSRSLPLLLVCAMILIAANAWLAFHAETILADSEFWVTHTMQVVTNLERLLHEASDAESDARGYVLTGEPRFLTAFQQNEKLLPQQIDHLERLTGDSTLQVSRLEAARAVASKALALLQDAVAHGRTSERDREDSLADTSQDLDLLLQLNGQVMQMESHERMLLAKRRQDSAQARVEARLTVGLASGLDILFVLISYWVLGYERRIRERARKTAERLQKMQSIMDVTMVQMPVAEMTEEILARLKAVAGAEAVAMYRCRESMGRENPCTTVEVVASIGTELQPGKTLTLRPEGPLARASATDQVVRLTGEAVHALPASEFAANMGSLLILPLTAREAVLGLVIAGHSRMEAFGPDDEELMRLVAERIASAIDRAQLMDLERQARLTAERNAAEVQALNAALEQRVAERTAELETTNRELEAFSYSVSHDLRAPLRSVDGFSVALLEDYGSLLQGDGEHYLARIRAGVQRMGQLIDALLQLSRITRAEISPEPVDLSALAGQVAEDVVQGNPGRDLAFTVEPGLRAECDPRLMRVVFENMFGNAAKFTSKVEHAKVEFGWSPDRKAYYIRDNGAGFDQQYAGKLFVAFQRLHGDRDFQGSGIGLATVARVIRRHHGDMAADGVVGQGATFWFTLKAGAL